MEAVINRTPCDLVLLATPIDLAKLLSIDKPTQRIRYEYEDHGDPTLESVLLKRMDASSNDC
jgi:predicted GTPase